ncbi:MAG: hypothetical protein Q6363_009445 [Candidatus Njordarchaeota archaeon]
MLTDRGRGRDASRGRDNLRGEIENIRIRSDSITIEFSRKISWREWDVIPVGSLYSEVNLELGNEYKELARIYYNKIRYIAFNDEIVSLFDRLSQDEMKYLEKELNINIWHFAKKIVLKDKDMNIYFFPLSLKDAFLRVYNMAESERADLLKKFKDVFSVFLSNFDKNVYVLNDRCLEKIKERIVNYVLEKIPETPMRRII